jgi:hypothetical protein
MTNTEINKRIAELLGLSIWHESKVAITVFNKANDGVVSFSPAEDWNQLMPLCIERGISLYRPKHINSDVWIASKYDSSKQQVYEDYGTNTQIALCLCLIKVLEAKEEGAE